MKTPKSILIRCLLLGLIIFCYSPSAGSESSPRLYSLPINQLEAIVLDYLTQSGFDIQILRLELGAVQLTITSPAKKWQIVLKPRSELTTEIITDSAPDDPQRIDTLDLLAAFIAGYIRGAAPKKEQSNQVIPHTILSQVGSVVCLSTKSNNKNSHHTGFVVDRQGLVLTTIHDVDSFHEITVTLSNGRDLAGNVIKQNIEQDLALINIHARLENAVSLAEGRNLLHMGERVYAVGCPIHLGDSFLPGIINGPPRRVDKRSYWQVNMQIHPGSSGSPVFDVQGNLVGIVKGRYRGTQSIGFLIPLETIIAFVKEP